MLAIILALSLINASNPQYYIDLGPVNSAHGMRITNEGDGKNFPGVLGGKECRIVDTKSGSSMIYVDIDDDYRPSDEVYVTIEYFDQEGTIYLEYDSSLNSPYRRSPDIYVQRNTGKWRTATFTLRQPDFRNRENGGTDFRIYSDGVLAISRIELSNEPPKGYKPKKDPVKEFANRPPVKVPEGMDVIQQWQVHEPVTPGMLKDSAYEICKKIGITSLQSYVGWAQLEPEQGNLTYDIYDPVVNQIAKHDLKWLPFLIAGPYIATPKWFREQYGVDAVCLEHNTPIRIQSIWNPEMKWGVRRFLEIFRQHYDPSVIEALNLGISGNWGESIFPAGGGFDMEGVHTHAGWWCGDRYAKADFQRWLKERFETIDALNVSWGSDYSSFDSISPFLPQDAPSQRAQVDMSNWYMQSMTDYAEYWVKTAREFYPTLPIYLCVGGDGSVQLGADFAAQARMCAKYNAGIRITNMGDDMREGFAITRMVSSATRHYGGYYTTEPGGDNTPKGIAGRIFDIVSGGGRGVYFKGLVEPPDIPTDNALVFADFVHYMVPNKPKLTVAALMPNSSISLDTKPLREFLDRSAHLRDYLDFDFIDENMISDNMLDRFNAVIMLSGSILEQSTIDKIKEWVQNGGVLIASSYSYPIKSVEGNEASWVTKPFDGQLPISVKYSVDRLLGVKADIGGTDESLLTSGWHGAEGRKEIATESNADPSYRWTMSSSSISLPVPTERPVILRVRLSVPKQIAGDARILVNGTKLIDLKEAEEEWVEVQIPDDIIKSSGSAEITFESKTVVPSESDPRQLGIQVFEVQLLTKGTDPKKLVPAHTLSPQITIDEERVYPMVSTRLGKGFVAMWPKSWGTYSLFLNSALHSTTAPWGQLSEPIDCEYDNVLACRVGDEVYYLNNGDDAVTRKAASGETITIEPRAIVSVHKPR